MQLLVDGNLMCGETCREKIVGEKEVKKKKPLREI
jgi:hypothetical protein